MKQASEARGLPFFAAWASGTVSPMYVPSFDTRMDQFYAYFVVVWYIFPRFGIL
jgi:hypothetical protein